MKFTCGFVHVGGRGCMNKSIEERAGALAAPVLTEAGFSLWDVVFEKEGAMNYLRILFDKENDGVTDEDCAFITAPINELMDKQDFIKHVDILEIGSPGLSRRLRHPAHFEYGINKPVRVLKRGDKGKSNVFYGTLYSFDSEKNEFTLKTDNQSLTLNIKNCQRINLDF